MSNVERLPRETADITNENIERIGAMFPNCLTEAKDERGRVVKAIDFDKLRQELSHESVEGPQERYQFNWPEKRKAMLLANKPTSMTLRPCREESVNFDTTQNLYIEGDNLDVLKLLRENYLGKIKMIYIDPPYNTGNDSFVYDDDSSKSVEEFSDESDATDEIGNKLFDLRQNNESNGRFHTDWLNMMYPRLKVAKDLLDMDGVIFISIDDNEVENLRKICDEIFGEVNFRNSLYVRRRTKSLNSQFADSGLVSLNVGLEYVLVYARSEAFIMTALRKRKSDVSEKGRWDVFWSNADRPTMRYDVLGFTPSSGQWRTSKEKADAMVANYKKYQKEYESKMTLEEYWKKTGIEGFIRRIPNGMGKNGGVQHWIPPSDTMLRTSNWSDIEVSEISKEFDLPFDNPKNKQLPIELLKLSGANNDSIVLDFFSGSATTAHAVMKLNAEDGGKRRFVMVQIPETCPEKSEAAKAGYKNICEIGKERIRRAGKKIAEENATTAPDLDIGFRVLKLDSSNMEDVFYSPAKFAKEAMQGTLDFGSAPQVRQTTLNFDGDASLASNIKPGRTAEDLLFQAMLRLNTPLSAKIETEEIHGKKVFSVMDGHLLATFDKDINEEAITAIAKRKPGIFVMCDGGYATDNVADNFEQIWREFSPDTVRRVI